MSGSKAKFHFFIGKSFFPNYLCNLCCLKVDVKFRVQYRKSSSRDEILKSDQVNLLPVEAEAASVQTAKDDNDSDRSTGHRRPLRSGAVGRASSGRRKARKRLLE